MKKVIMLLSLVSVLALFASCSAGYVADEPVYIETARPMRPSPNYIWTEGDWRWNNQTRSYNHQDGYWGSPNGGYNNTQGHWERSSKGYKWKKGHR